MPAEEAPAEERPAEEMSPDAVPTPASVRAASRGVGAAVRA
ncbi:MAG TPA: hypothetical protein VK698_05130 [Kofleriaceae bacterium]|nr:hypothetical protein [Kofleriaceae bacterium]